MGRQLNFTSAELKEVLAWPEARLPRSPSFAQRLQYVFGIEPVCDDDELVRWDVPAIPCAEVPRIGPVDRHAVITRYGEAG